MSAVALTIIVHVCYDGSSEVAAYTDDGYNDAFTGEGEYHFTPATTEQVGRVIETFQNDRLQGVHAEIMRGASRHVRTQLERAEEVAATIPTLRARLAELEL